MERQRPEDWCRAARAGRRPGRPRYLARLRPGFGRAGALWRAPGGERGTSVVELAVLAPALMMLCMLIIQFGLWFNARQAALAAAQAGATIAREEAFSTANWKTDAQNNATRFYTRLNSHLLSGLTATAHGVRTGNVYVTVHGKLGYSVFPFFGLHLTVSATAGGPVECFRPATTGGSAC